MIIKVEKHVILDNPHVGKAFITREGTVFICTGYSKTDNLNAFIITSGEHGYKVGSHIENFAGKNSQIWNGKITIEV